MSRKTSGLFGNIKAQRTRYNRRYPERKAAYDKVYRALKTGQLLKKPCFCGSIDVEAHHEDYAKALEVIWICRQCHHRHHETRG